MSQIDINEAQRDLARIVDAAIGGEEVVLTRDGQPVARLVPVGSKHPRPRFASARGLVEIAPDFDEPLSDFAEYEH